MREITVVLAEGNQLYGTERAALGLLMAVRGMKFNIYSVRQTLHPTFRPWAINLSQNPFLRIFKILAKDRSDVLISCNHYISVIFILTKAFHKKKVICWEHAEFDYARIPIRALKKFLYQKADHVVVVNRKDLKYWKSVNENTNLIHNIPTFSEPHKLKSFEERNIDILYVGRMSQERGRDFFEAIFDRIDRITDRKLEVLIIGSNPSAVNFKDYENLTIQFMDYTDDVSCFFESAKCYINPAIFESFGLSAFQALVSGVKVITWDHTAGANEFKLERGIYLAKFGQIDLFVYMLRTALSEQVIYYKGINNQPQKCWGKLLETI